MAFACAEGEGGLGGEGTSPSGVCPKNPVFLIVEVVGPFTQLSGSP